MIHLAVCNQGTSIVLRFTHTEASFKYIFDIYAKTLYAEPYKIQHVVIPFNAEDKKNRKGVLKNLLRSCEMKVYKTNI